MINGEQQDDGPLADMRAQRDPGVERDLVMESTARGVDAFNCSTSGAAEVLENYEQAQISIAKSLKRMVAIAEDARDLLEGLRGVDGAKRVGAYLLLIKAALDADDTPAA